MDSWMEKEKQRFIDEGINPLGHLPVLFHEGRKMPETIAIARFMARKVRATLHTCMSVRKLARAAAALAPSSHRSRVVCTNAANAARTHVPTVAHCVWRTVGRVSMSCLSCTRMQ